MFIGDHSFGTENHIQYLIHKNMSLRQENQTLRLEPDNKHKCVMQILLENNNKETAKGKSSRTESNSNLITRVPFFIM
jgi:regulator of replication initiation timing